MKMSHRGRPRRDDGSISEPSQSPRREEKETVQDWQFQHLMTSIQSLSNSIQTLVAQQQWSQQQGDDGPDRRGEVVPPPPQVVVVEPTEATSTAVHHKTFMRVKPLQFISREGLDKVKEWLEEMAKAFEIIEILNRLWVKFDIFMLVEDIKVWWKTLLGIKYGGQEPAWEEFI